MFCHNPNKPVESMASLLILGGVLPLCVAMLAQYAFYLPPCHFCMLQRYPYLVVIACGALSLLVKRGGMAWRACVALGIAAWLTTAGLGLYHTGIERGWLEYSGGCVADTAATDSLDDLRNQILSAPRVACNDVSATALGLSMASWNSIFAFAMVVLAVLQYRHDRKRHVQ